MENSYYNNNNNEENSILPNDLNNESNVNLLN